MPYQPSAADPPLGCELQVVSVPARVDAEGKFRAEEMNPFGKKVTFRAKLGPLIQHISLLTHLFPDTPKDVALA